MVHIYPSYFNDEFLLYDFVATRILFGCSLSPLHFICSVQASTVTTSLQQLLTVLSVLHVYVGTYILYLLTGFPNCLFICVYIRATTEAEGENMAM